MQQLIECVPNFSEGNNQDIIREITHAIESVTGVRLLNVDPGKATNRTVVTFVGTPPEVLEAAFRAIRRAGELIDMTTHHGEHPRMGATDVCPMIPVANISMEETARYALLLAQRVGDELSIPVYLYEEAQPNKNRSNLSVIRAGEYEGFFKKIQQAEWKPDYGPAVFDARRGGTVIGARDFLVAYNVNLNTTSVRRANAIAFDVREAGRTTTDNGKSVHVPGSLKSVKAIGWYIEEYQMAQISMNLTNIRITPVHVAFDEVCRRAEARGIRVTGSELVGLIPLQSMLDAGKYFLTKQKRSLGVPEAELIRVAVQSLGLNELAPFHPSERIIEYLLHDNQSRRLVTSTLESFADETSSERPAPGGGSVSAYVGALAAALGAMVANLSAHKKEWDERWKEFSDWAEQGQRAKSDLLRKVDEDTAAFKKIMAAFGLSKVTEEEKTSRLLAIQRATREAIEVPLSVMRITFSTMEMIKVMALSGNPNSVSDAGVAALCARSAVMGAFMNVRINASAYEDKGYVAQVLSEGSSIEQQANALEREIVEIVNRKIGV